MAAQHDFYANEVAANADDDTANDCIVAARYLERMAAGFRRLAEHPVPTQRYVFELMGLGPTA